MDPERPRLRIGVYGLWHLGCVTAACLAAARFVTTGLDDDSHVVETLAAGAAPVYEPGLDALISEGVRAGMLSFTTDIHRLEECDVVWITFDTPVDENDAANVDYVRTRAVTTFAHLRPDATLLISSQLPVGTTRGLLSEYELQTGRRGVFAYSPENLRLGSAIERFRSNEPVIVGASNDRAREPLESLFRTCRRDVIWMNIESAEMVKHAINAYLATSVTVTNEIATICAQVGAEAAQVEQGLRADRRIGAGAYVRPGPAFAGGTLARDVRFLVDIATRRHIAAPLLGSVLPSNAEHAKWALRELRQRHGDLRGCRVVVLGLAYKPNTDAIRRSVGVAFCREALALGATVVGVDPRVTAVPSDLYAIELSSDPVAASPGAHALLVATEWPEFRQLRADHLLVREPVPIVIDQSGWLASTLGADSRLNYVQFGVQR
jgi:UDPglucose 6-dehydrogenase